MLQKYTCFILCYPGSMEFYKLVILSISVSVCLFEAKADQPCAARAISGRSVVCVCNETYCDDVTRQPPGTGQFVAYTSSEGGLRFNKIIGEFKNISKECCATTLSLDPRMQYQEVEGFGGAVTDAAAINWKNLSETLQTALINAYFSDKGLEYNMVRVPIGGSDFSTHPYAYNDQPENDKQLSNFSLAYEDTQYKLPMLKAILKTSGAPIHIVATTWSPPVWMKSNHDFYGFSHLKTEYYQTYADYHLKFLQKYAAEGVKVWAITTTNEPVNGLIPLARFNSLGWTPGQMGTWIINNLGPTIRNSTFKDLKILTHDDQRYSIPLWFDVMVKHHPEVLKYIDGVAVHYYSDIFAPPSFLSSIPKNYPGKFVIATEACEGSKPWQFEKVMLGSWTRAQHYIEDILEDLNHEVVGWIDWNMCLNEKGGPNWAKNNVDSPIIVFPQNKEFVKQPMFYAMGHFSKFIPRGSRRIKVMERKPFIEKSLQKVAFLTPRGTLVVVVYNSGYVRTISLRIGDKQAKLKLDARSVSTIEFMHKSAEKSLKNKNIKL